MKTAQFIAAAAIGCCLVAAGSPPLRAQDAAPARRPATDAETAGSETVAPLREQSVYIPYTKLREVFEKQGRGVFLPYEKFQELWQAARAGTAPAPDVQPPVGVILTEIDNRAAIEKDVVTVTSKLKLDVLGKGWHEAPLRLGDAAIRSATIDGDPARIILDPQHGYRLLIKNDSSQATQHELALVYTKAFSKDPGQNSVSFQAPQAPVNRWRIRIPQPGVKVSIHPMIAATEAPGDTAPESGGDADQTEAAEETVVLAFVGAAPQVRIDWTPKAEGATGLTALATVRAEQEVTVAEGIVRTRCRLNYEISRAELSELQLEVPADQKVTGVFDPNVRQWEVAASGPSQTVTIQLFEPTQGAQPVTIEMEKFIDDGAMSRLPIPMLRALDVGRQQGLVLVRLEDELRAETSQRGGLLQLDASELPSSLQQTQWSFAYRYAALPFELVLAIEKVQPRIQVSELVEVFLEPRQLSISLFAALDIRRAGVFQLEVEVPEDFEVRAVRGQAVPGGEAAAIDTFHQENGSLQVNLARKALGKIGLVVELQRPLEDPNLLSPTGESSAIPIPLARMAKVAEQTRGSLVIQAPESLRIVPADQAGLRPVSYAEAYQQSESRRGASAAGLRPVLAFAFTPESISLRLDVERRRPQITARQFLAAVIESGVVRYSADFFFDVRYSGVKSLRIDVPLEWAGEIRNVTPNIREQAYDPQPADVPADYQAWEFTGETEFLGTARIQLEWEQTSEELEIGKSLDYPMPVLRPMGVDRSWGQVVIAKAETLDVRASQDLSGLRPIDPQQDLMDGVAVPDAARAFEFHGDWSLSVTATRYELEDVKRTSIERALLRMVVTRSDRISVQALYRMRSAVQRLAIKLPAGAEFDTDPLQINGQPRGLEHGDNDALFIPLVDQTPEEPFLVELRYTVPGDQTRLDFPVFPEQAPVQSEPAVQKVQLVIYMPEEMSLLAARGPWTNQQNNWYRQLNAWPGAPKEGQLLDWVSQGIRVSNREFRNFPTDGRMYAFTTLRPPPPPDGSLQLIALQERWLNLLVFGSLALVGLVFVRRDLRTKLVVLTLLLVALVLIGVFAPTLAMQLIDVKLVIAMALVVLVWAAVAIASWAPRLAVAGLGGGSSAIPAVRTEPTAPRSANDDSPAVAEPPGGAPAAEDQDPAAGGRHDG